VSPSTSSGSDPGQIRDLLERANGYAVVGRGGERVGSFIELAGPAGEQVAIRHDGVLLWRRRLLPTTAVAAVLPDRHTVVLNVDRRVLVARMPPPPESLSAPPRDEDAAEPSGVQERIARYGSASFEGRGGRDGGPHLLFASTSQGYALVEADGPPPSPGQEIEVPDQPGRFVVVKLGPSPLPDDLRACAYLEPAD
jgi:hypothetical protein